MHKHLHIVFCGMDGSGKSTLASVLIAELEKRGKEVIYIHGHGYTATSTSFGLSADTVGKNRQLLGILWPLAYLDNLFTYVFKYLPVLSKQILISDRYFYDKVVRMLYYGIIDERVAKLYLRLLPRPNVVFFLDATEKIVKERKQEYVENEYKEFRKWYKYVAKILSYDLIRTDVPLDATKRQIIKVIEKYI